MNCLIEQRINPRIDVCVPVNINNDGIIASNLVRNLSNDGLYITTEQEYEKGMLSDYELQLGSNKVLFKGEIVRTLVNDDCFGYGIHIVNIEDKFKENLSEFLQESFVLFNDVDNSVSADDFLIDNGKYETVHNVDVLTYLENEIDNKYSQFDGLETRLALANFPYKATLETYDFVNQPVNVRRDIDFLLDMKWIDNKKNVLVFGPTGCGKTHIAIGIATKAIEKGLRVNFITLQKLIECINNSKDSIESKFVLARLMNSDLIVLDELGVDKLSDSDSLIFKNFVNKIEGNISLLITSNITLEQFKDVVGDEDVTQKIGDNIKQVVYLRGVLH